MLVYGLSASDDIVFTGTGWNGFALRNGGHLSLSHRVAGRSLWDFVAGAATRRFYEEVFHQCRRSREPASLVYRCDSPYEERLFHQRILPVGGGELRLESVLVRARPFPPVYPAPPRGTHARLCSICLSSSSDGHWWTPAARAAGDRSGDMLWQVCPACARAAVRRRPAARLPLPA